MKFVLGLFITESNTFCPYKTTKDLFDISYGKEIISENTGQENFLGGVIDAANELKVQLYPTISAWAAPYGPITRKMFNHITNTILQELNDAGDFDGIILCLHGGSVAENCMDPEGELLAKIREKIGPQIPIICTLDMHSNISQRLINHSNAIFGNNENPHLDSYDRGFEATHVLFRIVKGDLNPVMVMKKPGLLVPTLYINPPHSGPLVEIFNQVFEKEKNREIINVNISCGFPWCDVPDAGMSVVAIVDNNHGLAEKIADDFSQQLWEIRNEFIPKLPSAEEAIDRAIKAEEGPVILCDVADNPGDGTSEDSTSILRKLIKNNAKNVGFALIRDPEAVEKCILAGIGNSVDLKLGGKFPRYAGEPAEITAVVKSITDGVFQTLGPLYGGYQVRLGQSVAIETNGIEIIVTERTYGANDPEVFRKHGIEPSEKNILVVKTFKMHMEPNYRSFAKEIIEVDTLGQAAIDLKRFNWKNISRPIFPIDNI
ncbi:MAG: M81 family metallopeptidase [Candidatus Hodarchaeota archaeon]